jgi:hypothetical protein
MSKWNRIALAAICVVIVLLIATDQRPDDTSIRTALVVIVLGLSAGLDLLLLRHQRSNTPRAASLLLPACVASFLALCTVSALWAVEPLRTLQINLLAWALFLCWFTVKLWVDHQPIAKTIEVLRWISIAVVAFTVLLCSEVASDQYIHHYLVNDVGMSMSIPNYYEATGERIQVLLQFLSQHMATISYLFWPTLMAVYLTFGRLRFFAMLAFSAMTAYAVWNSDNQTAMISLIVGTVSFVAALILPRLTIYLVGFGWFLATLAIMPITYYVHDTLQLQLNPHIPSSGQARFPIWHEVAQRVQESPYWGHGVVSLQALVQSGRGFLGEHAHSHNVFMQTWYETGFLGALALLSCGIVLLIRLYRYPRGLVCYGVATLVTLTLSFATTAWEIWVPWHLGIVAFTGLILLSTDRIALDGEE